ncbi:heat shock factor 1-like protein [Labeo rohita]|uniref:Heat shock factor 1-like protein n=1 Tax=Labeo rohita TaxID=84645 RepID=A0A498LEZ8_LABRO|nr:heat shock factor protein 1 [Labeo rohita]RXN04307.1 heat shock factor 1-like protein [Labeo rohita]RXN27593.1 heat shock factor 1-like protein [Labeo rohita]
MKHSHCVPAFVSKLWTLVEAPSTNNLISWSQDGGSFLVQDEQRFSKEVLPLYFKHSNMTSFVRQLNMYGFHKVVHMDAGLPKADGQVNCVEFQHENFRRAQPHLLGLIRRKVSVSRGVEEGGQVSQVLIQVSHVRGWQDSSDLKLMALCRDNESLWRELDSLRQNYQQQHKILRKIIKFIINIVQSNGIKGCKRKLPMIDNTGEFQSAPKYARSFSMNPILTTSPLQEIPSLQELDVSSADVYSNGMIISDITHLLDPTTEPSRESVTETLPATHSTFLAPASPTLPSMELALTLLDDPAAQESEEILLERNDVSDPLALINSSLAAIRSCSPPSPDLDNFSKIFSPGCHISAVKDSDTTAEIKQRSQNEADALPHADTVTQQQSLQQNADLEQEHYDSGEYSDILPSLLQLAQEASSLSFSNTTLPLELPFVI